MYSDSLEKTLELRKSIAEQGCVIVPEALGQAEVESLLRELRRADFPRSRAGLRHAMRVESVASVAKDTRLLAIAREVLGEGAFPSVPLFLTNPPLQTGWWYGIRTRHCRCASGAKQQVGDRGR